MGSAASAPARLSARALASRSLADESSAAAAALAPWRGLAADLAATASAFLPRADATAPERVGAWLYWSEAGPGGGLRLLRRPVKGAGSARRPPRLVLDAARLQRTTGAVALGNVRLSPDGGRAAVALDAGGDDWSVAVVEAGAAQTIVDRVPGATAAEWGPTGDLWFVRQDGAGRPAAALRRRAGVDAPVFSEADPALVLALAKSKDGRLLTLTSAAPDRAAVRTVDLAGEGAALSTPTLVAPPLPGLECYVEHAPLLGGMLVLTNSADGEGAAVPAGSDGVEWWLARAPRGAPPAAWAPLLPRRPGAAITDIDVFDRGVLVHERTSGGRAAVSLVRPGRRAPATIRLPPGARCVRGGANADFRATHARLTLSSPLAPGAAFDLCLESGSLERAPRGHRDADDAAAAATSAAAAMGLSVWDETVGDGVPVTVLGRAAGRGGPTLVSLYGSYGLPLDPDFNPLHLTLALRGWTIALAHVRGGGEKGRAWHAAGRGARRAAAAADARAALDWATDRSGPAVALAAESAGALLVGRLLADAPSSLAAVALRVPFLAPTADASPGEAGEWGAAGDDLRAVCPTAMLEEPAVAAAAPSGPPVLIQASSLDPRAPATSAATWAARLRAARGPGGAAVLLDARGVGHAAPGGVEGLRREAAAAAFLVAAVEQGAFRGRVA